MTDEEKVIALEKMIDEIYVAVYGEEESFQYVDKEGNTKLRGKYDLLKDIKEKFDDRQ